MPTPLPVTTDQPFDAYRNAVIPTITDGQVSESAPEGNLFWFKRTRSDGRTVTNLGVATRVFNGNRFYRNDPSKNYMTIGIYRERATGRVFWDDEGLIWSDNTPADGIDAFGLVVINPDNQPA